MRQAVVRARERIAEGGTVERGAGRGRLHERDSQVSRRDRQVPALREPARHLRRHQRLPQRRASRGSAETTL